MAESFEQITPVSEEAELSADAIPAFGPEHRAYLDEAREHLIDRGFYAYLMIDDEQRWTVAVDDEAGRVDVRLEGRAFTIEVCGSSPGLFIEESSDWRRQALERLARRAVPNVARGLLQENQSAKWDEDDRGVSVCIEHRARLDEAAMIPDIAVQSLNELDALLTFVESELRT